MGVELELTKMRERVEGALKIVKENAEKNNIDFDKDVFLQACKLAETMFVRSEIAYSGKK